ncbi:MAG: hypothetical protein ACXAEN_24995 [Candidatus Thorarchaeota archaeon]
MVPPSGSYDDELNPSIVEVGHTRPTKVRRDLRRWLERVDLPYYSPHKFRNGRAVHALKQAQTVSDLKAISQNLMHASLAVTDSAYAVLSDGDVQSRTEGLGLREKGSNGDFAATLRALADELEQSNRDEK